MAAFFDMQLDFILFFYGLAFVLLGVTCVAIGRVNGRIESWSVLALFGFVHGGSEWLDLTALVIGDTADFALARTVVMSASFLFLVEFARLEAIRFGVKLPGRWLYLPLVALVALGAATGGVNAAGIFARYCLGFTGAASTALVFARFSRGFSGVTKRLAIYAAVGFALYALAAGLVVPASSFWPASVFNYGAFERVVGLPIQLVRGLLALWIAFSLWAIWGQELIAEVTSARYTKFLQRQYIWTLATMATILVVGWILTEFLGGIYRQSVQQEARGDIDLLAGRLAGETATVDGMVKALAGSRRMYSMLMGGRGGADDERAKSILDLDVEASGASLGLIMNKAGAVVMSSAPPGEVLPDTTDLRSAPYFQRAMAGEAGHYFAFDAATGERNYYASYPVRAGAGAIVGVAVLKKSLAALEAELQRYDHTYFLVNPDGVVMLTNRPRLMLQNLWPLAAERRAGLSREFGSLSDRPMLQREIVGGTWTTFGDARDYVLRRQANHSQWSLVILTPMREIYASRVLGIVVTLLVALMALIYLFGRERWVHDSVQMEKRLQLQELARDLRFKATTDPLTGIPNRLKFDQALPSEMMRAGRYKAPLSLVIYDIDHFKEINDTYGHQIGDKVLVQLCALVAASIRGTDILARWGGEEFAIMVPSCDGRTTRLAAEKLRAVIEQFVFHTVGKVTCSFGVAQYVDGDTAAALITRADEALYRAKVNGRNRVELAAPPPAARPHFMSVA
jgi:diguanylate cyclase (GGDEF)-like protein